jgi:CspA family cold shock protein
MTNGRVKWYDEIKGFGFIESDSGEDVFVHRTGLDSEFNGLEPDQKVMFEIKQGNKGLMAVNVKMAD